MNVLTYCICCSLRAGNFWIAFFTITVGAYEMGWGISRSLDEYFQIAGEELLAICQVGGIVGSLGIITGLVHLFAICKEWYNCLWAYITFVIIYVIYFLAYVTIVYDVLKLEYIVTTPIATILFLVFIYPVYSYYLELREKKQQI